MARHGKKGRRCDGCGKISMAPLGEYSRKDGSAGYINDERGSGRDFCDECKESGRDEQGGAIGPVHGPAMA